MKAIIFLISLATVLCHLHFDIEPFDMANTQYKVVESTFNNFIDHFRKRYIGTFKQRYWSLMDFFEPEQPKAILYICGEGEGRFPAETTLPFVAAKQVKAALYSLEHRYYGNSQPVLDWSVKNLNYLTHEQGLADIAHFIESTNKEFTDKGERAPKWVVIGGSYAGAMSAWFRYKYPHLAAGSIASSAVVKVIADFYHYEAQMIVDFEKCPNREPGAVVKQLKEYHEYADLQLYDPNKIEEFLKLFKATGMTPLEFQYYFADLTIAWVQGGKRSTQCEILKKLADSKKPTVEQIKELAETAASTLGFTVEDYKFEKLKDVIINAKNNMRQWTYQVCTYFGWFQNANPQNNIRSLKMNNEYWKEYCKAVFDVDFFPDDALTNHFMGGTTLAKHVRNVYFSQGSEDGWQGAGVVENTYENPYIKVNMIECDKCSHCIDLKAPVDTDPENLKQARQEEIELINQWLS